MSFFSRGRLPRFLAMNQTRTFPGVHIRWSLLLSMILAAIPSVRGADLDLAQLFAKTSPSVVTLTVYTATGRKIGQGSGFIVDKSGVIVTCLHVIADAATVEIQSPDESTHIATAVIRTDKDWDVALLKVAPLTQPPLKLASPEAIRVGASVVAIGSPLGYGNTLSQGIISGLRPHAGKSNMIQLTAAISPGSSGGPILSASTGEILGLAVSSLNSGQNINFAAPADVIANELKTIDQPPERKLDDFAPEVKRSLAEAKTLRDKMESECTDADATTINRTIDEAIASGVGVYNSGDFLGCFRIYEGAAYKILFTLSNRSATAATVLTNALHKSDAVGNTTSAASNKAWIMREAFDSMNGIRGLRH